MEHISIILERRQREIESTNREYNVNRARATIKISFLIAFMVAIVYLTITLIFLNSL